MKIKQTLLAMAVLLSLATSAMAQGRQLVILFTDGTYSSFMLSDKPSMTFANHTMRICAKDSSSDFELCDVLRYYFVDNSADGIKLPSSVETFNIAYLSSDKLVIEHQQHAVDVYITDVAGKGCNTHASTNGGRTEVELSALPKGIYLVSINSKTIKIYKK